MLPFVASYSKGYTLKVSGILRKVMDYYRLPGLIKLGAPLFLGLTLPYLAPGFGLFNLV
jgi:hypothetical protein